MLDMDDSEDTESVTDCIDHWLNLLTANPIIVGGVKFRWTGWLRLMHHSAISNSKPIQEPAFHGRLMELNACDSTAYTACFIISQSALNPHLFSCAPILVSPGSDWWSSAVPLVEKEDEKKKRGKFVTIHALLSHKRWLNFSCADMENKKTGKLLQHLRSKSRRKGTACVKRFMEFHSTRRRHSHTLLTNHLESVNSSTLCSIRAEVLLKP